MNPLLEITILGALNLFLFVYRQTLVVGVIVSSTAIPITQSEARGAVKALQRAWKHHVLPSGDEVITTLWACIQTYQGYRVSRVPGPEASRQISNSSPRLLFGKLDGIEKMDWLWELNFIEGSSLLAPFGVLGGFLDVKGTPMALIHYPEG